MTTSEIKALCCEDPEMFHPEAIASLYHDGLIMKERSPDSEATQADPGSSTIDSHYAIHRIVANYIEDFKQKLQNNGTPVELSPAMTSHYFLHLCLTYRATVTSKKFHRLNRLAQLQSLIYLAENEEGTAIGMSSHYDNRTVRFVVSGLAGAGLIRRFRKSSTDTAFTYIMEASMKQYLPVWKKKLEKL